MLDQKGDKHINIVYLSQFLKERKKYNMKANGSTCEWKMIAVAQSSNNSSIFCRTNRRANSTKGTVYNYENKNVLLVFTHTNQNLAINNEFNTKNANADT